MDTNGLPSYVMSLLRIVGGLVGGVLIGKGWITAEQAPALGGALLTVTAVLWSIAHTANTRSALKAAIAAPAGKAS